MSPSATKPEGPKSRLGRVLVSGAAIAERVRAMGAEIGKDYSGRTLHVVIVLEGAGVFGADLARAIVPGVDVRLHFVRASSYGQGTCSSGRVRVNGGGSLGLADSHVLLVDDIVDSGRTARLLLDRLHRSGPRSVCFAALLSKPSGRVVEVRVDYQGFEIPDEFVVGYGMDHAGAFRDLPDIRVLVPAPF